MPTDDRTIALSATFTAEAIQPSLSFWAAELGLDPVLRFAGYNQVFQQLLDPAGLFARNRGFNVALVRFADWREAGMEAEARRLVEAVRTAAAFPSPLVLVICPPAEAAAEATVLPIPLADLAGVHVIAPCQVQALYPVAEVHDPARRRAGPPALHARVFRGARHRHRAQDPRHCDAAVQGDRARLRRHPVGRHLRRGRAAGRHPRRAAPRAAAVHGGAPPRGHAAGAGAARTTRRTWWRPFAPIPRCRCDWRISPPAASIGMPRAPTWPRWPKNWGWASTASSWWTTTPRNAPKRRPARRRCWRCRCPPTPREIPEFLRHVWAFDRARVTDEDRRRRANSTRNSAERARAGTRRRQPGEFLASLRLEIAIAPMSRRAGGARGAAHPAHQPDERHLRAAHRGRDPARSMREMPGGAR